MKLFIEFFKEDWTDDFPEWEEVPFTDLTEGLTAGMTVWRRVRPRKERKEWIPSKKILVSAGNDLFKRIPNPRYLEEWEKFCTEGHDHKDGEKYWERIFHDEYFELSVEIETMAEFHALLKRLAKAPIGLQWNEDEMVLRLDFFGDVEP